MSQKKVYAFGGSGGSEGNRDLRNLLGGKGAGLAEMSNIGLPIPPGFTITTEVCNEFFAGGGKFPGGLRAEVDGALKRMEQAMGTGFGDARNPLLVSVRSGARASMPGMMDTVLNLGLNDVTVKGLAERTGNRRFAYDCYRRFVQMYGDVVMGIKAESEAEADPFEEVLERKKKQRGVALDTELTESDLESLVGEYKALIARRLGRSFPDDPVEQLWAAIGAVFNSWGNARAVAYRELHGIPALWGTAVNVQAMVFGNLGDDSGTGVAFTRDPASGENVFYGEYLVNAQGEDVVAGTRTPQPISKGSGPGGPGAPGHSLEETFPPIFQQLLEVRGKLERHYRDMQDMEFTIQRGKLWMLQTRSGKRTGRAAIRIAFDMVEEGLIDRETALERIEPETLNQFLRPVFDANALREALKSRRMLARGLPAGPGAATGMVAFTATEAEAMAARGNRPVLVRIETSPEDIRGMKVAEGILTARGGMTSHAALVARQMGKVCIVGCDELVIDYAAREMRVGERRIKEGEFISLDGTAGQVIEGTIPTRPSDVERGLLGGDAEAREAPDYRLFTTIMEWADASRQLEVWANADQPDQAATAVAFGAQGIGLCRTEHMFFGGDRIDHVRQMILASTDEARRQALSRLEPLQREDFKGIFRAMGKRPVTIRLLDPPLHEFLPQTAEARRTTAKKMGVSEAEIEQAVTALHESNPMLGHRGCRLGITSPEIYEMQVRAVVSAAAELARDEGLVVVPEIMIPLVGHVQELAILRRLTDRVAAEVQAAMGVSLRYHVGTMIELPRACVTADEIAAEADFFSFGTNDLTQTTFGLSRDDAGRFLTDYVAEGSVLPFDPFVSIDRDGVGALMREAVTKGRGARSDLKVGICGEHGGDPSSIHFCQELGLNYVSCSPYRLPIARLAAAQAALGRSRAAARAE